MLIDHVSITPWLTNLGYQNCFLSAAFIGLGTSATFLLMIRFGKRLRELSARRYWDLVVRNGYSGSGGH